MTGVDLQEEVEAKLAKNAGRSYRPLPNGVLVKTRHQLWPTGESRHWLRTNRGELASVCSPAGAAYPPTVG